MKQTVRFAALFALFIYNTPSVVVNASMRVADKIDNCADLVAKNECTKNAKRMNEDCPLSCLMARQRVMETRIPDKDPSFYELQAKTSTGSILDFDQFNGRVTLVMNILKTCLSSEMKGVERTFGFMETMRNRDYPEALEVIIFMYDFGENRRSNRLYERDYGCNSYEKSMKKKGRTIHIMEEVEVNGPKTHPVYKYLKSHFDFDDDMLPEDLGTIFLIGPDGKHVEAHIGSSVGQLKFSIAQHIEQDL